MELKIEKGVPIPTEYAKYVEAIKKMVPGDSFLVEKVSHTVSANVAAKRLGFRMTSRKEGNKYRCWLK